MLESEPLSEDDGRYRARKSETFELVEGKASIDIRGVDEDHTLLLVDQTPIAISWSDRQGGDGYYVVRGGVTDLEEKFTSLRHILDGNIDLDAPLSQQIYSFLELFVSWEYGLEYHDSYPEIFLLNEFDTSWKFTRHYDERSSSSHKYYFTMTQPSDSLDEALIHHYVKLIESGAKPIILMTALTDSNEYFVLDGHHKMKAYIKAGVPPTFILIYRIVAPEPGKSAFKKYFHKRHPLAGHYSITMSGRYYSETRLELWRMKKGLLDLLTVDHWRSVFKS